MMAIQVTHGHPLRFLERLALIYIKLLVTSHLVYFGHWVNPFQILQDFIRLPLCSDILTSTQETYAHKDNDCVLLVKHLANSNSLSQAPITFLPAEFFGKLVQSLQVLPRNALQDRAKKEQLVVGDCGNIFSILTCTTVHYIPSGSKPLHISPKLPCQVTN